MLFRSFFFSFFFTIRFLFLFFLLFFLLHTHAPTPISIFTLFLTFCFCSYLRNISPLLPLSFFLSLTHTKKNLSPSISHKQIISHTHIDHQQRTKIKESWPFKSTFMHAAWFAPSPLVLLPTSKNMQLNHQIG